MEMHSVCRRISLVSIPFVLLSSRKSTPRKAFWTTVIAKTLERKEVGDRLAQQSLSPVLNDCPADPSRAALRGPPAEIAPICPLTRPWSEVTAGTFFQTSVTNAAAKRHDFALWVSKSVPQRLKPSSAQTIYGTAEPVPFVRLSLPQPLRVSEGQLKKSDLDSSEFQYFPPPCRSVRKIVRDKRDKRGKSPRKPPRAVRSSEVRVAAHCIDADLGGFVAIQVLFSLGRIGGAKRDRTADLLTTAGTDRLRAGSRSATVPPPRSGPPTRMLLKIQELP
jgi:hypothetical protein